MGDSTPEKKPESAVTRLLSSEGLVEKKTAGGACVLFHVWATWCLPCLQELPKLLPVLERIPNVTPVVIDISSTSTQEKFSRKWVETILKPKFITFRKPEGPQKEYRALIDEKWDGSLPYSLLLKDGKKQKEWSGVLDLSTFEKELATLCK